MPGKIGQTREETEDVPWLPKDDWDKWHESKDAKYGEYSTCYKLWLQMNNMNTVKYWALLSICYALGFYFKSYLVFFVANVVIFGFVEYLFYFGEYAFFNVDTLICIHYINTTLMINRGINAGFDYGFTYREGKRHLTEKPYEAQCDKFDFVWDKVGLEPGMTVIDVGCGVGDWLAYLKRRGVNGYGINISQMQVDECRHRGLDVVQCNIKKFEENEALKERFYGTADLVTFWDTIEHYVGADISMDLEKCDEIYGGVFRVASKMMNPKSKIQKVWNSCLHRKNQNSMGNYRRSLWDCLILLRKEGVAWKAFVFYVLERVHGGTYPCGYRDTLNLNAQRFNYELTFRQEVTYDYLQTSYNNPDHFGEHRIAWDWDRVCLAFFMIFTMHNWWLYWIWFQFSIWVYQFDDEEECSSFVQSYWSIWTQKFEGRIEDSQEKKDLKFVEKKDLKSKKRG